MNWLLVRLVRQCVETFETQHGPIELPEEDNEQ